MYGVGGGGGGGGRPTSSICYGGNAGPNLNLAHGRMPLSRISACSPRLASLLTPFTDWAHNAHSIPFEQSKSALCAESVKGISGGQRLCVCK